MSENKENNDIKPQKKCCGGCLQGNRLQSYDWLSDLPESHSDTDLVEVQFKNTRKGYFRNPTHIELEKGEMVAVESTPGHDIGEVTLTGKLVLLQMKKNGVKQDNAELKRVYRKVKPNDMEKYAEAKGREHGTMLQARKIAEDLKLNMKIGDVEYQGDGNKAIFYYIADDRVDFRQLIKVLADTFKVRIEMKQIGARQEAGRIGGIGPCGRQLCCSSWMTNFISVATSAARYQDISLNPQKLAGQCAKLKCCLNYEVDAYVEGIKRLPSREIPLETKDSTYFHFKTDIFKRQMTYSTSRDFAANLVSINADRVFEIIGLNKKGIRPDSLEEVSKQAPAPKEYQDVLGQDSLTRFDKSKRKSNNGKNSNPPRGDRKPNNGENRPSNTGENSNAPRNERRPNNNENRPNNNGENNNRPRGERKPNSAENRPINTGENNKPRPEKRPHNSENRPINNGENNNPTRGERKPQTNENQPNNNQRRRRKPFGNNNRRSGENQQGNNDAPKSE